MPFSADLTKIVTNFQTIDPTQHSINENFDQVGKRSGLQNFWRWFVHVITCGLIARNPELDAASSKIVTFAKQFFKSTEQPTAQDLNSLKTTFTKLETIICENQGAKYSQVHALAERVEQLLAGKKVAPLEEETGSTPTLTELVDQMEALSKDASDEGRKAVLQLAKALSARVEQQLATNNQAELVAACNQIVKNEEKFQTLVAFLMSLCNAQQAKELFQNVQFVSEEQKAATVSVLENHWPNDAQRATMRKQFAAALAQAERGGPIQPDPEFQNPLIYLFDSLEVPEGEPTPEMFQTIREIIPVMTRIVQEDRAQVVAAFNHAAQDPAKFGLLCKTFVLCTDDKEVAKQLFTEIQWSDEAEKAAAVTQIEANWPTAEQKAEMLAQLLRMAGGQPAEGDQEYEQIRQTIDAAIQSGDFTDFIQQCNSLQDDEEQFGKLVVGLGMRWKAPQLQFARVIEQVTFPSEELKSQILGALISMRGVILQRDSDHLLNLETFDSLPLFELNVDVQALFGYGDHTEDPAVLPESYAKALADTFKSAAVHCLKEESKGVTVRIGQQTECRFSAAMVRPILAHLTNIPGVIRLDINDIGVELGIGFVDEDAEALLQIVRSNPLLRDFRVNTNSMTMEARNAFHAAVNELIDQRTGNLRQEIEAASAAL